MLVGSFRKFVLNAAAICAVVASCATASSAQSNEDEIKLLYYEPTPGRIAFTYDAEDSKDIYVLDFQTLTIRPLIEGPGLDEYPAWSPDGRMLAFYSDRTGDREIYTAADDGATVKQITNSRGVDEDPDWSPDGAYLVFRTEREEGFHSIYIVNNDGTNPRLVTRSKEQISLPKWSPRGTEILFTSAEYWPGWDVVMWELNSKQTTLLTNSVKSFLRPSWHPSGGSFLVSYGSGSEVGIWAFEKGAAAIKPVFDHPGKNYDAVWIDGAKKVAFVAEVTPGEGKYELFIWDRVSGKISQVTQSAGSIRHPSWTPYPSLRSIAERFLEKLKSEKSKP